MTKVPNSTRSHGAIFPLSRCRYWCVYGVPKHSTNWLHTGDRRRTHYYYQKLFHGQCVTQRARARASIRWWCFTVVPTLPASGDTFISPNITTGFILMGFKHGSHFSLLPFCHFLHIALRSHVLYGRTVSTISLVGRAKSQGILLHVFHVRPHSIHRSDVSCISFFILNGKITLVTEFDECNAMVLCHDYDPHRTLGTCSMFIVFVAQKHEPSQCERMQHDRDCHIYFREPRKRLRRDKKWFSFFHHQNIFVVGTRKEARSIYLQSGAISILAKHANLIAMLFSGQKCPSTQMSHIKIHNIVWGWATLGDKNADID